MGQDNKKLDNVISIDQDQLKDHVSEVVPSTVEQTLNGLLDAEADRLCNAPPDTNEQPAGRTLEPAATTASSAPRPAK